MASTPLGLSPVAVTALTADDAWQDYFTVPVGGATVRVFHICNRTGELLLLRIAMPPTERTPTEDDPIAWDLAVPANQVLEFGAGLDFPAGTICKLQASAAGLTVHASGLKGS